MGADDGNFSGIQLLAVNYGPQVTAVCLTALDDTLALVDQRCDLWDPIGLNSMAGSALTFVASTDIHYRG